MLSKAPARFPAHEQRLQEFHGRGELLMVGTFGDPFALSGLVRRAARA